MKGRRVIMTAAASALCTWWQTPPSFGEQPKPKAKRAKNRDKVKAGRKQRRQQ